MLTFFNLWQSSYFSWNEALELFVAGMRFPNPVSFIILPLQLTPRNPDMKRAFLLLSVLFVLASCQKEVSFDTADGGTGGGTGGGGGSTADTYQPVTKDSYWKYVDSGIVSQTVLMTATGQQKTLGTKTYQVMKAEITGQPTAEGYYYVNKPLYGLRQDVNNGIATTIELTYLNDTASVGYTWSDNMPPVNGLAARFNGAIVGRNLSMTVAGKNYTNVIHSQMDLEYEVPILGWTNFATYHYYVAKGVGIIRVESDLSIFGGAGMVSVRNLVEYSIK